MSHQPKGYFGWNIIDGEQGCVVLKNALHNLSKNENGDNHEHAKGVLVGVVSVFMASGMSFDDALKLAWQLSPKDVHPDRVPESWRQQFCK